MDGMLSQDEISALLDGMDLSLDDDAAEYAETAPEAGAASAQMPAEDAEKDESLLSEVEKDAIGEVANISMGSSATTLYSLVNRKVNITTPVVTLATWKTLLGDYEKPCVFIQIKYTKGLDGTNILILKEHDVKVITDLMMGGDGTHTEEELGELHLSAISEAMNQMMGAAATSLSTMLKATIDISPPDSTLRDLTMYKDGAEIAPFLGGTFVKIAFRMQIDGLVDSTIMQLYPIEFARRLVSTFMDTQMGGAGAAETDSVQPVSAQTVPEQSQVLPQNAAAPQAGMSGQMGMSASAENPAGAMGVAPGMDMSGQPMQPQVPGGMYMNGMPGNMNPGMYMGAPVGMPQMGAAPMMMNPMMGAAPQMNMQNVNVQPAQFQNFSNNTSNVPGQENIGLIMDVPLEVTVELGRTTKSISEILNFAPGTIIELDRIAGEPIDVLVNGKFVARGEVVVIEESFGVRVTEIIK